MMQSVSPPVSFSMTSELNSAVTLDSALPRRRRIDRNAGRALELLGHAIEYLTDEFVYEGCSQASLDSQLEAIQLLMALNRQIYLECPEVKSIGSRILARFGIQGS
jgi:hypothetical protein